MHQRFLFCVFFFHFLHDSWIKSTVYLCVLHFSVLLLYVNTPELNFYLFIYLFIFLFCFLKTWLSSDMMFQDENQKKLNMVLEPRVSVCWVCCYFYFWGMYFGQSSSPWINSGSTALTLSCSVRENVLMLCILMVILMLFFFSKFAKSDWIVY